jgi:hypothetical protein
VRKGDRRCGRLVVAHGRAYRERVPKSLLALVGLLAFSSPAAATTPQLLTRLDGDAAAAERQVTLEQAQLVPLEVQASSARTALEEATQRYRALLTFVPARSPLALLAAHGPADATLLYATASALAAGSARQLEQISAYSQRESQLTERTRFVLGALARNLGMVERERDAAARLRRARGVAAGELVTQLEHPGRVPLPPRSGLAAQARIVADAQAELARGVHEVPDGSNNSPDIDRYRTATAGAFNGQPWCAYFVSYIMWEAGVPLGDGGQGIGYVPALLAWAQSQGRFLRTGDPKPGDIFILPQHTGIVVAVDRNTIHTIEGNYANRVAAVTRPVSSVLGFVRMA